MRILRRFLAEKPFSPGSSLSSLSLIASMAPYPQKPFLEFRDLILFRVFELRRFRYRDFIQ